MSYTPIYPGGWKNGKAGGTPITAAALNHMEDGIAAAVPIIGKGINLLDNWYFQNPVNQRGLTTYTGSGSYTIDRWILWVGGVEEVHSDGLYLAKGQAASAILYQYLDFVVGNDTQVTFSALLKGNASVVFMSETAIYNDYSDFTIVKHTITIPAGTDLSNTLYPIITTMNSCTVVAVKLELGDTQTLARNIGTDANPNWVLNDPPPDYGTELFKCQTSTADAADTYANNIALMVRKDTTYPDCNYRMNGGVQEWLNPPLVADTEYRTTERYLGKPVYQKICTFDSSVLPTTSGSSSSGLTLGITNRKDVIGYNGVINFHDIPLPDTSNGLYKVFISGNNIVFTATQNNQYASQTSVTICVKYTKTTD